MQLTVCCETIFTELPLTERFSLVKKCGIDAVELWGVAPIQVAAIAATLKSSGCQLALFCGNRAHSLIDDHEHDGFFNELRQSIANAETLGCQQLTILSDKVDSRGIPIPSPRPLSHQQKRENVRQGLRSAAKMAQQAGITLLLEPLNTVFDHPGYFLCDSASAFELIEEIGSPWLKVLYDIYHLDMMGENPLDVINSHLPGIGHFHVADAPGRHEPGTGHIDYQAIAQLLRTKGFDGTIGLECTPRDRSEAAIQSFCNLFR